MDRKPETPDPELGHKLENEIPYVIDQMMQALQRMYQRGHILVSANSEAKTRQLRIDSYTIEAFIEECCVTGGPDDKTNRKDLYDKYVEYCKDWERQSHGKNSFYKALRNKGFTDVPVNGNRMFRCIRFADENGFVPASENAEQMGDIPFDA
jgi:phage/plasmid-associated DNA primase